MNKQTPFTPTPMVDRNGNIITTFTLDGKTFMLSQDIEAATEYVEKMRSAIEKANKNRVDTAPALPPV
jgi:ArsR family metal-binding transcriptional regulator